MHSLRQKPAPSTIWKFFLMISIVVVAALLIAASFAADKSIQEWILALNQHHWSHDSAYAAFSKYGDWPELMLLGGIGFLVAKKTRKVRWQRILLCAMIASTIAGMMVNLSRLTTGRTRPRAVAEQGWYGPYHDGKWLIGRADFNSFPSGHTATAVGFAGVILFAAPWWGVPAMGVALMIALSRVFLGAHHPSDVVTAAVVSLAIAWVVWQFLGKKRQVEFIQGDKGDF